MPTEPAISVIVATRDRPGDLARCVASILACDHDAFELVVVDQSDRPAVLPDDERLRYVHSDSRGKSAGVNVGLATARAELLLFTDDDCTVPASWIRDVEDSLARHDHVGLAFGDLRAIEHDPSVHFVPAVEFGTYRETRQAWRAYRRGGAGADLAARRAVFDAIGGFDEMVGPGARFKTCEEYDVYYRTLAAGFPVAFTPEFATIHWGARSYADGSGRRLLREYAFGEGAVIGKHLRLLDVRMLVVLARIVTQYVGVVVGNVVRHRRLSGAGAVAALCRGVVRGVRTPVDRQMRLFVRNEG